RATDPLSLHDALPIFHGAREPPLGEGAKVSRHSAGSSSPGTSSRSGPIARDEEARHGHEIHDSKDYEEGAGQDAEDKHLGRGFRSEEHTSELQSRENL